MKKIIAMMLATMMVFALSISVFAADPTVAVTLDTQEVEAGGRVNVSLDVSGNPGIATLTLKLQLNKSVFTMDTTQVWDEDEEDYVDPYGTDFNEVPTIGSVTGAYQFVWSAAKNYKTNGSFVSFDLIVANDAEPGVYPLTLTVKEACKASGADVAFATVSGTVTVKAAGPVGPTVDDFTAGMSATITATDATANLVIGIPEGADLSKLSVAVDGVAATLPAAVNDQIKLPTAKKAARNLAEQITYTITYDGASKEITTSLADYAAALAAGEDQAVAAVGQAMLNYGAAARAEFDKTGDAPEIVGGVADASLPIVFDRFDATALNAALRAPESTVSYTALTATYETEITLSMALRVNDNYKNNVDAAAQWVADNFKIDGKDVAVSTKVGGGYTFVVITVAGIAVEDVKTPMAITVAGADAGTVCVANYLASVEAAYATNPAKAGQLNVARALFAYATALEAIA